MGGQVLRLHLDGMRTHCDYLDYYINLLKKYEGIRDNPSSTRRERDHARRQINWIKKKVLPAIKRNLNEAGKGMADALSNLDGYPLTPEQKRFWYEFNIKVMSKWDMRVPCRSCDRMRKFLREYKRK